MLFNSYEFIFAFLPVLFLVYFFLNSKRLILGGKIWLVLGSLFFYSYWNPIYLPLLLLSILTNYGVGITLSSGGGQLRVKRKSILTFGILFNVALLGYFKYTDFFIENFNGIFGAEVPLMHIVLPLGISFFTFTQIAFLVDAYKGEAKEYNLLNYMLFVSYFPHLLAGPILHHKEMMPQFESIKNLVKNYRNIALGLFIFSIGLFKKVVIADSFAVWANAGFENSANLTMLEAWATSLSYTFQLYFDFSAYADMAIGVSLLFNIRLPINFNSPYKSLNIQDFWRRWHITLGRFLRDYIYIPLGGNRKGHFRTYNNLVATFLIGGIWHGAGWTFVVWGLLHGLALALHRAWSNFGLRMNMLLAWFVTFNFINITWVFFRAKTFEEALNVLNAMFNPAKLVLPGLVASKLAFLTEFGVTFGGVFNHLKDPNAVVNWMIIAFILVLVFKNSMRYINGGFKPNYFNLSIAIVLIITAIFNFGSYSEFIYFNF